jgi:SpoVK/Ycf46/Vps4 family AAA+-type ATPase
MLRPGRFDCIIPVGGLDKEGRATILEYYLAKLNTGNVNVERIVAMTSGFTPADIQYLYQQAAHFAFEQELASKEDYQVTAETFVDILPKVPPSLSDEVIDEFEKDSVSFSRV